VCLKFVLVRRWLMCGWLVHESRKSVTPPKVPLHGFVVPDKVAMQKF
jgi:hypothetical protein